MSQKALSNHQRISEILACLNQDLFEKEKVIGLALLSAIAGESIFLLGPPGVAKSMIARRLKYAFSGAKSFEYLMGKFSTPDEVFGPVSIRKLKEEDRYERLTDRYLPGANIVFLDEIWKASPPIQNSLLTVLNEKIYRNGEQEFKVDIRGLISASNELPLKGEGLEAIWDRFLIRLVVAGIEREELFNRMITMAKIRNEEKLVSENLKISHQEYEDWSNEIDLVEVPSYILGLINHIRKVIKQRNLTAEPTDQMYVSDRRWRKITQLLKASAFLHDRKEVSVMDCFLVEDCIWDEIEQVKESQDIVLGSITNYGYAFLVERKAIMTELNSLQAEIKKETQIVKQETVPIRKAYTDPKGTVFYRVPAFWGETDAYLRMSDVEKIKGDTPAYIPVFEESGKSFRPFQTLDIGLVSDFVVTHKEREFEMEQSTEERELIIPKKANAATKKIWDSQILLLEQMCEENLMKLESRKHEDEGHLTKHIFVARAKSAHVMDSLDAAIKELLNYKLDIQKTQHAYESMDAN
ncbi:MAG: AAA family ATPase [Bacteroidota bacterium]